MLGQRATARELFFLIAEVQCIVIALRLSERYCKRLMLTITLAVIAFQAFIFITTFFAGKKSSFIAIGWVIFTLFGSIHTTGLLLLQIITIIFAYSLSKRSFISKSERIAERILAPYSVAPARALVQQPAQNSGDIYWHHFAAMLVVFAYILMISRSKSPRDITEWTAAAGEALGVILPVAGLGFFVYVVLRVLKVSGKAARIIAMLVLILSFCSILANSR
jgi:hypothetical protein